MKLLNIKSIFVAFTLLFSSVVFGQTHSISGNTDEPSVTLSWLDGTVKSVNSNLLGNYSISVSDNWSGAVTPTKTGYTFDPTSLVHDNVIADVTDQNYTATIDSNSISGNTGVGVTILSWSDGSAKTITSDGSGDYSLNVSYDWSGIITPSKTGYTFDPTSNDYTNVIADLSNEDYSATLDSNSISGNTGVGGVTLNWDDGSAKSFTSGGTGNYSINVSYDWTGTITPSKTGYTFDPTSNDYTNVIADLSNEDYSATLDSYIISGNTETGNATLSWTDGTLQTTTSDINGNYSLNVSYNWSGTVSPSKIGFTFDPTSNNYTNVIANQTNENYSATLDSNSISGNTGVGGVTLNWNDGSAKSFTSGGTGNYSINVYYNWTGTVTPSKTGYLFTPASNDYSNIITDQTNEDYTAALDSNAISGNTGVGGVTLNWNDGSAKSFTSGGTGNYSINVSYNWTGTVTPSKTGYTFSPVSKDYNNIISDQTNQNYTETLNSYTISGNTGVGLVSLTWFDETQQTSTSDATGNYSIGVPFNWSGTITPSKTGYTFNPANKSYENIIENQLNQNYTDIINQYIVTASANPQIGGNIEGLNSNGEYDFGEQVNLSAIPKTGYSFVNWTSGASIVSVNPTLTFAATNDSNLVANFSLNEYTITVGVNPSGTGEITGLKASGKYNHGDLVNLTATPNIEYSFVNWTSGESIVDTNNTITFTATSDSNLIANFELKKYTISTTVFPSEGGRTIGDSVYSHGDEVTVTAIAESENGYDFINWTEDGSEISTEAQYSFTANMNRSLVANFELRKYQVVLEENDTTGGSVIGNGEYIHGNSVTAIAIPNPGWLFANWSEVILNDTSVISDTTHYNFFITSNRYLIANFSHNIYSINASSDPIDGGSISGSGSFFYGQTATLKANSNSGWQFVNWTSNGTEVSTESEYSFSVTENNSFVAHFARTDFNITCSAFPIDGGFTSGCGFSRYNQEITITAEAYNDWEFKNWTENGNEVSTDAQYTFNVFASRNLVANFDKINGIEKMDGYDIIPQNYYISNAYPNPFNPETSFQFGLPEESFVKLIIFDISGQIVETVLDNSLVQAGNYVNHFNAANLPSGIYIYLINANSAVTDKSFKKSGKLLLLK